MRQFLRILKVLDSSLLMLDCIHLVVRLRRSVIGSALPFSMTVSDTGVSPRLSLALRRKRRLALPLGSVLQILRANSINSSIALHCLTVDDSKGFPCAWRLCLLTINFLLEIHRHILGLGCYVIPVQLSISYITLIQVS